ncbi:transglutaminase family protein [Bacillaceae bacterium SIJ1]|uniref:transglutaminase-like domain-containing protein n=1 Tax=Litoribacterium kuwaitense TaxID=1398745 RepID=UPI0013E9CD76|nr:transglutaminase family protein [Litoribacterium kuwaitense]NGP45387.1 transglutaminase family protein [Litoribacterium kuwaitense]
MNFFCESTNLSDYLLESPEVDYTHPLVQATTKELFTSTQTEIEKTKIAFEFVRDQIAHSWDIQSQRVTYHASEVLAYREGICYAKSHLLAAILRSQMIPTGFCYQRLMLFDTPEKGYCVHALNPVYLQSVGRWVRLDARGNKQGIDAQFSLEKEKIAFAPQEAFDEIDYSTIFVKPHPATTAVLLENTDAIDMYRYRLPEALK